MRAMPANGAYLPSYGPRHAITCIRAYPDSENPDQPAHPRTDHGFLCLLTESLGTAECTNGEQRTGILCACAGYLNLYVLRMLEGTFSFNASHY